MMQGVVVDTAGQAHANSALVALLILLSPCCQNSNAYMQNGIYMIWSANWCELRKVFFKEAFGASVLSLGCFWELVSLPATSFAAAVFMFFCFSLWLRCCLAAAKVQD